MNCKKGWERRVLVSKFDRAFVDKHYKGHLQDILLDKERSLLPATQPYVEREIEMEKIDEEMEKVNKEIAKLKSMCFQLSEKKRDLTNGQVTERKKFIRACSREECRGFLTSQWKCGICEYYTCKECHEVKEAEHECNEDNVKTAKLLEKDTKACPGCGTGIFKIEGCSQMFCVDCHTVWDWNTGRIDKGVVHNPHFYEYQRRTGNIERQVGEVRCGREIDQAFLNVIRNNKGVFSICVQIVHIRQVEMRRYTIDRINDNMDLRILFMRNKITEEEFKVKIQKRQKESDKKREILNILDMFVQCGTEVMYRNYTEKTNTDTWCKELENLRIYTNECFLSVSDVYKSKKLQLSVNFKLM
jgi:hypothetical protein